MKDATAVILAHRGLLCLSGPDARTFLQGIVSNDVGKAQEGRAVWSAFLTPQGKFLHDFFILSTPDGLLLTPEAERQDDLMKRLKLYKLRSQVEIEDWRESHILAALFGGAPEGLEAPVFGDPRLEGFCRYAVLPKDKADAMLTGAGYNIGALEDFDRARIPLGLPDGSRDLEVEKAVLLDNGFDELKGVDWNKGCYMGQELTARTKYRGLTKKRLLPVTFSGGAPAPGTQITAEGKDAGEIRSSVMGADGRAIGLALIRLDKLDLPLEAAGAALSAKQPDWVVLPEKQQA